MIISVFREAAFCAAHRLYNPAFDDETNLRVFGACSNPQYHGHNYTLIVKLTGEIDPKTGYLFDMKLLKQVIKDEVAEPFDHRNLNLDVADFKNLNPTAENIAIVIWNRLRKKIHAKYILNVRLYETERNFVEYEGL